MVGLLRRAHRILYYLSKKLQWINDLKEISNSTNISEENVKKIIGKFKDTSKPQQRPRASSINREEYKNDRNAETIERVSTTST